MWCRRCRRTYPYPMWCRACACLLLGRALVPEPRHGRRNAGKKSWLVPFQQEGILEEAPRLRPPGQRRCLCAGGGRGRGWSGRIYFVNCYQLKSTLHPSQVITSCLCTLPTYPPLTASHKWTVKIKSSPCKFVSEMEPIVGRIVGQSKESSYNKNMIVNWVIFGNKPARRAFW